MAQCPNCQTNITDTSNRFCPNCGGVLPAPEEARASAPDPADFTAPPPPPLPPSGSRSDAWGAGGSGGGSQGPGGASRGGTAWDDRDRIGFISAFVETTREVMLEPKEFFRKMPVTGGLGGPFVYGLLVACLGMFVEAFYNAVMQTITGSAFGGFGEFGRDAEVARLVSALSGWGGFVILVVLSPVIVTIMMFLGSGLVHLCLMLLGGAKNGFEATFRAWSFSQAPALLSVVPFCGGFIGGIWRVVLAVIGLAGAHGVGYGIAAGAVLLPIVLLCCCCGIAFGLMGASIASLANLGH